MKKRKVWRQVRTFRDAPLVFTKHLLLGYGPNKAIDRESSPPDISLTSTRTSLVWRLRSDLTIKLIPTIFQKKSKAWLAGQPAVTATNDITLTDTLLKPETGSQVSGDRAMAEYYERQREMRERWETWETERDVGEMRDMRDRETSDPLQAAGSIEIV